MDNINTPPGKEIPEEYSLPPEAKTVDAVSNSKKIVSILVVIAVIINLLIFTTGGESVALGGSKIAGLLFSALIIAGIIYLGLAWSKTVPAIPTVDVANINASVGGACDPVGGERIAREPGTPPSTPWVVLRTYVQKSMAAKAAKYVPSLNYLSYGFADMTRTLNFTGQKQKCTGTGWANVGGTFAANVQENITVQVSGGGGGSATLQAWDDNSIKQSVASGYTIPSLP